jgi:hypothetical protein
MARRTARRTMRCLTVPGVLAQMLVGKFMTCPYFVKWRA